MAVRNKVAVKKKKWKKISNMNQKELQDYIHHLDEYSPGCKAHMEALRRMEVYEIGPVSITCV